MSIVAIVAIVLTVLLVLALTAIGYVCLVMNWFGQTIEESERPDDE